MLVSTNCLHAEIKLQHWKFSPLNTYSKHIEVEEKVNSETGNSKSILIRFFAEARLYIAILDCHGEIFQELNHRSRRFPFWKSLQVEVAVEAAMAVAVVVDMAVMVEKGSGH